jgi:hypothetical protein
MNSLRSDDPGIEQVVRFALSAGQRALASLSPSNELSPLVLRLLAAVWWYRLGALLPVPAFNRLAAEIRAAGIADDEEFFAVLLDLRAPAVTSFLNAAPRHESTNPASE